MLLISSPISKKSSRLTASDSETCTTGGVLISTRSVPLIICNKEVMHKQVRTAEKTTSTNLMCKHSNLHA